MGFNSEIPILERHFDICYNDYTSWLWNDMVFQGLARCTAT